MGHVQWRHFTGEYTPEILCLKSREAGDLLPFNHCSTLNSVQVRRGNQVKVSALGGMYLCMYITHV